MQWVIFATVSSCDPNFGKSAAFTADAPKFGTKMMAA